MTENVRSRSRSLRRSERDCIEASGDLIHVPASQPCELQQSDGYRQVRLGDLHLRLGPLQAKVVRQLHEAAEAGAPWCVGKTVLADVGATSERMADMFKSQKRWRELIESDRRGRYRLRLRVR